MCYHTLLDHIIYTDVQMQNICYTSTSPHSGHPFAAGRAQDHRSLAGELILISSPAKERCSANCATQPIGNRLHKSRVWWL